MTNIDIEPSGIPELSFSLNDRDTKGGFRYNQYLLKTYLLITIGF